MAIDPLKLLLLGYEYTLWGEYGVTETHSVEKIGVTDIHSVEKIGLQIYTLWSR